MGNWQSDIVRFKGAEFQKAFLACVYQGDNLLEACAKMKVNPAALGIFRRGNSDFDKEIREAQAFRQEIETERLANIDQEFVNPIMAGVISKNIQWLASKRARQIYGDKVDINHNHTISIRQAMNDARARVIDHVADKPMIENASFTDMISDEQGQEFAPVGDIDPLS